MSIGSWLVAIAVGLVAATLGWLLARRGREVRLREIEMELAAARAQLEAGDASMSRLDAQVARLTAHEEQLAVALNTARSDFVRADAEVRFLSNQVDQIYADKTEKERQAMHAQAALADASARLGRLEAELLAANARGVKTEALEERLSQVLETAVRQEAELKSVLECRHSLEMQVGGLAPLQQRVQELAQALARAQSLLEAERARTEERAQTAEHDRHAMRLEFEALGQKLIEEKGKSMLDQSHKGLEGLLSPVRERLKEFEEKFQKTFDQDNRDRASLLEKLRQLQETQSKLHDDALSLSRALSGESRAQGDWGELVLESLLSTAGLTEGREYDLQVDHLNTDGNHRRPDVLVYLPPNRAIVIDAKCSVSAFIASTRATSEEERESQLDLHVQALRSHVKLLAAKEYQSVLKERSLDFVFLFVPSEAAFCSALSRNPGLSEEAMRLRVVLCSPTTVLATLQMVHHVWRSERQTVNAQRIAEEAGKMIDKLSAALESFTEVGERLGQAHNAFDIAKARLATGKGNVMNIADKVVQLGARVSKPEKLLAAQLAMDAEPDASPQAQLQLEVGSYPTA